MQDKLAELDVRVTEYEPITSADLKATRTKDWESARKKVRLDALYTYIRFEVNS